VAVTPTPDGAFFLDLDVATAEARAIAKNDPFPEPTVQRQKRRAAYERLIAAGRFQVLDALLPREAIARRIRESLGLRESTTMETLPS
jgi:thymidylate kinase